MTIACQSPLTATNPVQVPGAIQFRLTLQAGLKSATVRIAFVILDHTHCIRFANGTWLEEVQAQVSTTGTVVVHNAQLKGVTGNAVSTLKLEARVTENGAFQCLQQTTVGVSKCTCQQQFGALAQLDAPLEEVVAMVVEPTAGGRGAAKRGAGRAGGKAAKKAGGKRAKKASDTKRRGGR